MEFQITDEQRAWKQKAQSFAREAVAPHAVELDVEAKFSREIWEQMADFGMTGFIIPKEYGGLGYDTFTSCLMFEGFGAGGAPFGVGTWCHPHLNDCAMGILEHGTEALKQRALPKMASGEWIGAFALSEWAAGSDAAGIRTTARREGDHYVLDGVKAWITNGPICDLALVLAYTDRSKGPRNGMTAFVVEEGFEGFSKGRDLTDERMGERPNQNGELIFEGCRVPIENRLGEEGQGNQVMRDVLFWERAGINGMCVGMMEYLIERSVRYACERETFGKKLHEHQVIVHKLAEMKLATEAARLIIYKCACGKRDDTITTMDTALAKMIMGDNLMKVALEAVQIHGGRGYLREYEVERYIRDAKVVNLAGGSDEILRDMIGMRVVRDTDVEGLGPYLREKW